jgi:hypothetical protein
VDGSNASAGQVALVLVQFSALSQFDVAGRQTLLVGSKSLAGQTALVLVQYASF